MPEADLEPETPAPGIHGFLFRRAIRQCLLRAPRMHGFGQANRILPYSLGSLAPIGKRAPFPVSTVLSIPARLVPQLEAWTERSRWSRVRAVESGGP